MNFRMSWVDAKGWRLAPSLEVNDETLAATIAGDMAALSNATNDTIYFTTVESGVGFAGADNVYQSVYECAKLTFASSVDGGRVFLLIPAPSTSLFLADQETVDPSVASALIADVLATVQTTGGNPVDSYVGGYRVTLNRKGGE